MSRACMQGGSQIAVEHALIVCKCLCAHVWLQVSCLLKFLPTLQVSTTRLPDLLPSNMTIVYDTNDASNRRSMHEEMLAIEALPFMTKLSQLPSSRGATALTPVAGSTGPHLPL